MGRPQLRQEKKKPIILVVDDEPIIRDLCARALQEYQILQAGSGAEALQRLQQERVDLILTDVMMPGLNGLELLKTVKEHEPNQAVVIMTGFAEKDIILRALKAAADDFISKPINLLQLRTTIQKVLERKALKEELLQLKRLDRLKSDFLGLVSHKLKTPITAISLFVQNLAQGFDDPTDPHFRQTMALILEESDYLNALIQDLLNYSQIILQDGPPRFTLEKPLEAVRAMVIEKRNLAVQKGVCLTDHLEVDCPAIPLDRQRFSFALQALLDNSVKFTPRGGEIEVTATVLPEAIQLVVRDTGKGIPREELPKIFEKFYQVDPSHTGQVRGFGLGLYYARHFVQMHGGTLKMESEPGVGTMATILLPRQ
ncbi:MAG: response regulator [Desulfuromonadales bacterium]|nr:response regulator [Desulfuromonadales bacterium]